MSSSQNPETGAANAIEETGKEPEKQNLRFTPLRSHIISRARALAKQPRTEPALSRLIPVPRLQS